eukprot:NP_740967.1 Uncharacterized protein CELE_C24H12.4 [Caenorhabditis elegans]
MAPDEVTKKKRKSVKFAEEEPPKVKEAPKKQKAGKKIEVSVELRDKNEEKMGRKRKHRMKKSQAEKRQKLMESLVGPQVDEMDFEPEHKTNDGSVGPSAVIIAPTKELITQIYKLFVKLSQALPFLQAINLCDINEEENSVWLEDRSHVVVTTPGKLLRMCSLRPEYCTLVSYLVMDEADLLLSFGYEEEMIKIRSKLPPTYQCLMTSATLKDDMTTLKKLFMTGPVITIKLTEGDLPNSDQLTQYQLTCGSDEERFAILVAMFKLKLIVGRSILFVNTIDRCYKLMLILRVFGLKSCILNSAMPANSRCHVINQFNEGSYQIVIASDVSDADGSKLKEEIAGKSDEKPEKDEKKGKKASKLDKESGVSRGIDFHHVSNVVNFDFPETTDAYIHRVGRTARGFNKGTALSFCIPSERAHLEQIQEEINQQMGRKVLQPYEFRIKELDTFLLRTREALSKCTKGVIKKARLKEIRQELMRSANLQTFFAKNEREKLLMQTDCHPVMLKINSPAIADVTSYMVPEALRGMDFSAPGAKNRRYNMGQKHRQKLKHKFQKKGKDPLKTFKI